MNSEISSRHIEKLDGTNFQSWRFQLKTLLVATDVFDVVNGTREKPSNQDQAGLKLWIKDDAKAQFLISSSLDRSQHQHIQTCEASKQMWDTLATIHERRSATHKLLLGQRFHQYTMEPTDSVASHISKVKNMAVQLLEVGENVPDTMVMAKILASLPSKYRNFRSAWSSVDPTRQTVEHLQERLLEEDSYLEGDPEETSALVATTKSGSKGRFQESKPKENKKRQKARKDIECFCCHQRGHFARQCPQRNQQDGNAGGGRPSQNCALVATCSKNSKTVQPSSEQITKLRNADPSEVWLTDSGASAHMTSRRDWFVDYQSTKDGSTIVFGDDYECEVVGKGTIAIERLIDGEWREGTIENVLHVPKLRKNLLSVGQCMHRGYKLMFEGTYVKILNDREEIVRGLMQENNVFRLFIRVIKKREVLSADVATTNLQCLHERLGHLNARDLKQLVDRELVAGVKLSGGGNFFCEPCQLGKAHRLAFKKKRETRSIKPGEVIHSDVCGPMPTESVGGARFFVTFIDEATNYKYVYLLKHKSDVFERFKQYERAIANKFGENMKILRSDNGREYCNMSMQDYLKEKGIKFEPSAPYTPEQNGRAERSNRTIVECARTMLLASGLPRSLWAEAVNCAVYLLNRVSVVEERGGKTAFELWTGKKPNLEHVRAFGSVAYAHIPKKFTGKFDARVTRTYLVGYENDSSNYRVYNLDTKKVTVSRNVTFSSMIGTGETGKDSEPFEVNFREEEVTQGLDQADKAGEKEAERDQNDVGTGGQDARPVDHEKTIQSSTSAPPAHNLRDRSKLNPPSKYASYSAEIKTPVDFREATTCEHAAEWSHAINEELAAHAKNGTWTIIPRDPSKAAIRSKWVFKVSSNQNKPKFKARLCAKGFMQQEGVDYTETFSPVVRYDSLRFLLALAAHDDFEMATFDVRTAFLYGELAEDIHMELPDGISIDEPSFRNIRTTTRSSSDATQDSKRANVVCKLNKSLYGLKQAPRCWNRRFRLFLDKFNFVECKADSCVFVGTVEPSVVYLGLFVDDGLIISDSIECIRTILNQLQKEFEITIGDASRFVGLQINRDRASKTLHICQEDYTRSILKKFGMSHAKPVTVPADPHTILHPVKSEDECMKNVPYREAVGSLMYLALTTRPDIAFSVNSVSRFLNKHNRSHWSAVKRIFSYLVGTTDAGIMYRRCANDEQRIIGFSDADYANDTENRRSITGYVFMMSGGAITWSSQRQKLVTLSTTEAEYVAAATAAREVVWLRKLLLDIERPCVSPTVLYVDNQGAIKLAKNAEFHKRTKHIDTRYHFLREKQESGELSVQFVPTNLQKADGFTKALPRDSFRFMCDEIGLSSPNTILNRQD